jgi:predicted RNase H-like HicB family nuclease
MRPYIALIHKESDSDYGVSFPDLPGCISAGATLDEARAMAEEALALHLEGLSADSEALPEPSSLETIMDDASNRDGVAILVDPPKAVSKSVRLNITLADDLLEQIDRHAEANGLTRSGFLARAARHELSRKDAS